MKIHPTGDHNNIEPSGGITLREYYAGLAMQGICANEFAPHWDADTITTYAVQYADALINALNKE